MACGGIGNESDPWLLTVAHGERSQSRPHLSIVHTLVRRAAAIKCLRPAVVYLSSDLLEAQPGIRRS